MDFWRRLPQGRHVIAQTSKYCLAEFVYPDEQGGRTETRTERRLQKAQVAYLPTYLV
jgi:hypothetical protein